MVYKGKLSPEKMVELYNMGFTVEEIAKQYGYKNGEYITCKLRMYGVYNSKNIDRGKVFALHKAGWTTNQIAEEMVTSIESIMEVLNERI